MQFPHRGAAAALLSLLASLPVAPPRPNIFEIPLRFSAGDSVWGGDRDADHATVAVNSRGDVAVAYHTTRQDYPGVGYPLKQVELAILTLAPGGSSWSLTQQELLGGIGRSPLHPPLAQTIVRCERPDIVAVGEHFFVTWTRRYDRSFPGQSYEPAVLECAWLAWNGARYEVLTGGQPLGQGYILDADFDVRECAGVADAVALDPGGAGAPARAAAVYAHQTDFGDDPQSWPPFDDTRLADLRIATSGLDAARTVSGGAQAQPLVRDVPCDGEPEPLGGPYPALYLPDCTPGATPERFWLAFQEQRLPSSGSVPDGRIRLAVCETVAGSWVVMDEEVFGDPQHPGWRHRAALDSSPATAGGLDRASLAFVLREQPTDSDVVYGEWGYDPQGGIVPVAWPPQAEFPNSPAAFDLEPVPLHGPDQPLLRRCYHRRDASVDAVRYYDVGSDRVSVVAKTPRTIARPAVATAALPNGGRVIATTWEMIPEGRQYLRIMLSLER